MSGTLYKLDFASGKSYIGVVTGYFNTRMKNHENAAMKGGKLAVNRAWRKYGKPVIVKLAIVEKDDLMELERKAVIAYNTLVPNGYNMVPGGRESPTIYPEVAAKVSASLKGRIRTEEHIKNITAAVQGKVLSEEHKRKISASLTGRKLGTSKLKGRTRPPFSAEWCKKISEGQKRNPRPRDKKTGRFLC